MGYSPWGHKESDTTEHKLNPLNWILVVELKFSLLNWELRDQTMKEKENLILMSAYVASEQM